MIVLLIESALPALLALHGNTLLLSSALVHTLCS